MKMYDAMQIAHREFVQLARVRGAAPAAADVAGADVAPAAADLDARLAELDGSDWTGLVVPDADDEAQEVEEKEGKHPDFVPPKPVSVSKDYDDPTSILGRAFRERQSRAGVRDDQRRARRDADEDRRGSGAPDALADRSTRPASNCRACWTRGGRSTRRICRA